MVLGGHGCRRTREARRSQFRLLASLGNVFPVLPEALQPMLFHPDFTESAESPASSRAPRAQSPPLQQVPASSRSDVKKSSATCSAVGARTANSSNLTLATAEAASTLRDAYNMFSATSPSPTRSMIKEANDHLQLLHGRVVELEATVHEQAEALIKKDEQLQTRLKELADAKDARIRELTRIAEAAEQRSRRLEQQCRDKDAHIDALTQRCSVVDDLAAYTPLLERLVHSLKKVPPRSRSKTTMRSSSYSGGGGGGGSSGNSSRLGTSSSSRTMGRAPEHHRPTTPNDSSVSVLSPSPVVDGLDLKPATQALSELRISRSFSINQNFSMSEDDDVEEDYS